ncbi:MAG: tetratricopeptide repeat protein [Snowella sp.]|nr:tetratricopeptide repeat protein [Snowella sp.]
MKASSSKRSRWVYVGLVLMIGALLLFSIAPLVNSIVQQSRGQTTSNPLDNAQQRLEAEELGYQLVLEREPDNVNALQGLLENRLRQGNLNDAIAPLERLAQLKPEQREYTILLAQTKQQVKDYAGAATIYRTLLANNPLDIRGLKGLADLLMAQNRDSEAIQTLQNAITQAIKLKGADPSPTNAANLTSVQLLLGEFYLQQKRWDDAIALYNNTTQMNPDDFRPILAKAILFNQQGQAETAQPLFEQALILAPTEYKETIKKMSRETFKPPSNSVPLQPPTAPLNPKSP